MRKFMVFFFLCPLLYTRTEAKVKHRVVIKKECLLKKKTFPMSGDSIDTPEKIGVATWYSYRGGLFAASTKFKKGSVIRVINPSNNKHVDVIINDYGPTSKRHPNRILDLDRVAFQKIASLGVGVISIIICPLRTL